MKPKLSFSLLSKIEKYEKTGNTKYLQEAIDYWLGFKTPPNKAMEEGTRVHKMIEVQNIQFGTLDTGEGVRESYFTHEIDDFIVHGIIDRKVSNKIFDYKLSKLSLDEDTAWSESLEKTYGYQQNVYSLSDENISEGYIIKISSNIYGKSKLEKLTAEFSKPFTFTTESRKQTLEKINRHYKILQKYI